VRIKPLPAMVRFGQARCDNPDINIILPSAFVYFSAVLELIDYFVRRLVLQLGYFFAAISNIFDLVVSPLINLYDLVFKCITRDEPVLLVTEMFSVNSIFV